jgi:rhamnogalacturonan endolyase
MSAASCLLSVASNLYPSAVAAAPGPPVAATSNDREIVLDNGIVSLTVDRHSSNIIALTYRHAGQALEVGKHGQSMYFDSNGGTTGLPADVAAKAPRAGYMPLGAYVQSVDLASNTANEAEVVAKGGPTTYLPFSTEVHYVVKRGLSGYYAYCVYHHGVGMAAGTVGQTRFVVRGPAGPALFTDVAVDNSRLGAVDESPDVKTVSDATFLQQDGHVYCKYDNSAFMAQHHVHGMSGHGVGVWMINPSEEYVNGGPIKQELTVHQDNTLLNMLQGGHFGAGGISVAKNEN